MLVFEGNSTRGGDGLNRTFGRPSRRAEGTAGLSAGRKYAEPIGTPNPGTVKSGGPTPSALTVPRAVGSSMPCCHPVDGTPLRAGGSLRPGGVPGQLTGGGGGASLLMAHSACTAFGDCCGARSVWSPCVLQCALLGLVPLPCSRLPYPQLIGYVHAPQPGALSPLVGALRDAGVHCVRGGLSLPFFREGRWVAPLSFG